MNRYRLGVAMKDMASANGLIPVLKALPEHIEPFVCAEGLAIGKLEAAGIPVRFRGSVNFTQEPFEFPARHLIESNALDAVLVGLSYPNNIEWQFAKAAKELGRPVAFYEDFWESATVRAPSTVPDVLFATDEYARSAAARSYPFAKIFIVGDPAAVIPEDDMPLELAELQARGQVMTYFGGGAEATTAELTLLAACLKKTSCSWHLVPRFHPKIRNLRASDGSETWGALWERMLAPFGSRIVYIDEQQSELIVQGSDVVVSSFSKLMTTAAVAGKTVIAVWTDETRASIEKQSLLREPPHVKLGFASLISSATDLSSFTPSRANAARKVFQPLDAALMVSELESMLSR